VKHYEQLLVPSKLSHVSVTKVIAAQHNKVVGGGPLREKATHTPIGRYHSQTRSHAKAAQAQPSVTFVGVAALDQLPAMRQFVATFKMGGFTQLTDLDDSVWRHFGVIEQPAFAFVSSDGSAQVVKGALSDADLDVRLSALAKT
jgi:hypothetical protein